jgi:hypothetical protein
MATAGAFLKALLAFKAPLITGSVKALSRLC